MKKKYVEDYKVYLDENQKGRVKEKLEYTGKYYWLDTEDTIILKFKVQFGVMLLIQLILFITMGMLNNDGSRVFYVLLPYVCGIMPLYYLASAFLSFPKQKVIMELVQYENTIARSKRSALGIMIVMGITLAGDIVYMLISFENNQIMKEILFFLLGFIIFLINFLFIKLHSKLSKCINIRETKE